MSTKASERRIHPRVAKVVSGHIYCHQTDMHHRLTARNISCSGVLCHVNHFIPEFTELGLKIQLPLDSGETLLDLKGVIVRVDPQEREEGRADYEIAVFFSEIDAETQELIGRFIVEHEVNG